MCVCVCARATHFISKPKHLSLLDNDKQFSHKNLYIYHWHRLCRFRRCNRRCRRGRRHLTHEHRKTINDIYMLVLCFLFVAAVKEYEENTETEQHAITTKICVRRKRMEKTRTDQASQPGTNSSNCRYN